MNDVIIIRMKEKILSQTCHAINEILKAGGILTEAKVDNPFLQLIFQKEGSEFKEKNDATLE